MLVGTGKGNRRESSAWMSLALLLLGLGLVGCAARSTPPASPRARERAAPNSAVRSGRVSAIRLSGLRITIVLGGGRTVLLRDGRYRHRDGYVLIVSNGQIVGLEGIPPGQIVAGNRGRGKGKKKGHYKDKNNLKIRRIKVQGTRLVFVDEDDGEVALATGVYSGPDGAVLRIEEGRVVEVETGS